MRIPNNELHHRHIASYGAGGFDLTGQEIRGCPLQYKHRYELRNIPEVHSDLLSYGSVIHHALYLVEENNTEPLTALEQAWDPALGFDRWEEAQDDMRRIIERGGILTLLHTLAVELDLSAPLYEDEDFGPIAFGGIIDLLGIQGDAFDQAVPAITFVDYKTDRGIPTHEQMKNWVQGIGYAWLVRENRHLWFPDADRVRVTGIYDAVKRWPLQVEYPDQRLDEFQAWAEAVARTILRDTEGKPRLNPGCTWCPVRVDCPEWNGLPGDADTLLDRLSKSTIKVRFKQMQNAQELIKRLERMVADTKAAVMEKIRKEGPYKVGDEQWGIVRGNRREIVDLREVHKIMGDDFYLRANMTLGQLDEWLNDHLEVNGDRLIRKGEGPEQLKRIDDAE
jgi:hypothetical protein